MTVNISSIAWGKKGNMCFRAKNTKKVLEVLIHSKKRQNLRNSFLKCSNKKGFLKIVWSKVWFFFFGGGRGKGVAGTPTLKLKQPIYIV